MDASWQPDPTGRHQYRWWDGAGWTESVADDGRTNIDPLNQASTPAGAAPTVLGSSPSGHPGSPPFANPSASPFPSPGGQPMPQYAQPVTKKPAGKGKWVALGVVVVLVVGVVGFLVFGGDSGSSTGTGETSAKITKTSPVVTRKVKVKAGSVYSVRVAPEPGLDTSSVLLLSAADADAAGKAAALTFSDLFSAPTEFLAAEGFTDAGSEYSDVTDGAKFVALPFDDGAAGKADKSTIIATADATYTIAVGAATTKDAEVRIVVDEISHDAAGMRAAVEPLSNELTHNTEFTGELSKSAPFIIKQISLKKGEAVRIRVEPSSKLDTRAALLGSDADIEAYTNGIASLFSDPESFTPDSFISDNFSEGSDLFSDEELTGDLGKEKGTVFDHDGDSGEPDTDFIYAFSDLSLTLVVGSYGNDSGTVKIIFEKTTPEPLTDISDADSTFSDDPFFTDTDFFTDSDPYTGS